MAGITRIGAGGHPGIIGAGSSGGGGGGGGGDGNAPGDGGRKDDEKSAAGSGGAASDQRDRMESRRATAPLPAVRASGTTGLPMGEADAPPVDQQIAIVRERLEEAESAFRFMGTGHPEYEATKRRVEQYRAMLQALEG